MKVLTSLTKHKICIALLLLSVILVIGFVVYYRGAIVDATLRGVWTIRGLDNNYKMMIVKDDIVLFESMDANTNTSVSSTDRKTRFIISSFVPSLKCITLKLHKCEKTPFPALNECDIKYELYPPTGIIIVRKGKDEICRMIKDNAFTEDHFDRI